MFNKYLQFEDENYINEEKKQNSNSEYLIQDMINQIKTECENFLFSEFKIIIFASCLISFIFFFLGKPSIALLFVISFLLGVITSLISVYQATIIAVSNCKIVLNQSKYFFYNIKISFK